MASVGSLFTVIEIAVMLLWILAGGMSWRKGLKSASAFLAFWGFILLLIELFLLSWFLGRPPLRTMGETRLVFAAWLTFWGLVLYRRWGYSLLLFGSLSGGACALGFNLLFPDALDKTMMPALQSVWFVPHVVVYLLAYALLGLSAVVALGGLMPFGSKSRDPLLLELSGNLLRIGCGFLGLGLVMGAIWAKEAWGHYWAWDPKETWALATFLAYLFYLHLERGNEKNARLLLFTNVCSFLILCLTWVGMRYLPVGAYSVHSYGG